MAYRVCKFGCRTVNMERPMGRRENKRPKASPSSSMYDSLRSSYVKHTKQEEEVFSPNEKVSSGPLLVFVLMRRGEEIGYSNCSRGHNLKRHHRQGV